jgi:hypothetical protein
MPFREGEQELIFIGGGGEMNVAVAISLTVDPTLLKWEKSDLNLSVD